MFERHPDGATPACAFCLRTDRPLTREHVFARWLVARVRGARLVATSRAGAAPRISRFLASVCADCNAGWMSGLEVSFRQAVFARARVGPIAAGDRLTLSRWFTKTAVLVAEAHGVALVGPAQRARLRTGMPDDVDVFIARRRRPPQPLDLAIATDAGTGHGASVALLVDGIVGHVAPRGTLAGRHGTRMWPLRSHVVRWETLPVVTALLPRAASGR